MFPWRNPWRNFAADFLADFPADFSAAFSAEFFVDFAGNCRRIFLKKVPKPFKTKDERDFPKNAQGIPAQILPGCGSLLFSGCPGLTQIPPPPAKPSKMLGWLGDMHHANAS